MAETISVNPHGTVTRAAWLWLGGGIVLGILVGLLLIPVSMLAGVRSAFGAMHWNRTTAIDTSAPSVVEKIRQLSRLESVEYSVDKIVEGNRQAPGIPSFLTGDRLLLIAHGQVIAGVDLSTLTKGDLTVDGDKVRVHLPAPQIFLTRIDNDRTRVYERSTGLLVVADPNLESQVRQAAENEITKAAMDDHILDQAQANARVTITGLLYALGFHRVDVN